MSDREQAEIGKLKIECLQTINSMPAEALALRNARLTAGRIHMQIVEPFLTRAEKLNGWFITGYAATIALAIGNADKVATTFGASDIKGAVTPLLAALLLYWVQRMVTDAVLASGEALTGTASLTKELDTRAFTREEIADIAARMVVAHLWPLRKLAQKNLFAALAGDWDAGPRFSMQLSVWFAPLFFLGNAALLGYGMWTLVGFNR